MKLFFAEGRSDAVAARGEHEEKAATNDADDNRQTDKKLFGFFGRNRE